MDANHLPEKAKQQTVHAVVLTVSDTRTKAEDRSGRVIREKLLAADHQISSQEICPDEAAAILQQLEVWLADEKIQAVIMTGGTGISKRDITVETVAPLFSKTLDGFGELFRFLSYTEDVGSKALLSRATAGIIEDKAVFLLPGSSKAVKLAMDKLIIPELPHIVHELTKHRN